MSQARHRQALSEVGQPARPALWRASDHRFGYLDGWTDPYVLEASPAANWEKINPMRSYKASSNQRIQDAGAHLSFDKLASSLAGGGEKRRLFAAAAGAVANSHGLLGLFYEYCSDHVAPPGKSWVAPNAIISGGKMRLVDPETEGKRRLEDLLYEKDGGRSDRETGEETGEKIRFTSRTLALPEELEFYPTERFATEVPGAEGLGAPPGRVLTWADAVDLYGVVALLDADAERGVSIVPRRERLDSWELECKNFPRARYDPEIAHGLNGRVAGVSPYTSVGEDGVFGRGWRCRSLLQAMYFMVYLEFTGGNRVRRCKRPDCRDPYRLGPQESDYCSSECMSVMTTRRSRGQ